MFVHITHEYMLFSDVVERRKWLKCCELWRLSSIYIIKIDSNNNDHNANGINEFLDTSPIVLGISSET